MFESICLLEPNISPRNFLTAPRKAGSLIIFLSTLPAICSSVFNWIFGIGFAPIITRLDSMTDFNHLPGWKRHSVFPALLKVSS
uniref:Uncharacterized protein n=1 Tax=uncultured marine virus TaxID=186617 RepID=A0A0F7L4R0_9VIRU|nr:hypothetical protein [uncultured marine virus]